MACLWKFHNLIDRISVTCLWILKAFTGSLECCQGWLETLEVWFDLVWTRVGFRWWSHFSLVKFNSLSKATLSVFLRLIMAHFLLRRIPPDCCDLLRRTRWRWRFCFCWFFKFWEIPRWGILERRWVMIEVFGGFGVGAAGIRHNETEVWNQEVYRRNYWDGGNFWVGTVGFGCWMNRACCRTWSRFRRAWVQKNGSIRHWLERDWIRDDGKEALYQGRHNCWGGSHWVFGMRGIGDRMFRDEGRVDFWIPTSSWAVSSWSSVTPGFGYSFILFVYGDKSIKWWTIV